ncbi:MAG: glycosyltransferase family 2 protein [Minisyncoccota bacterium]
MKISFVIPAHNEEVLIGECLSALQSALAAGDYDAEIIVVNNASTDRTGEIARSFRGVWVIDEPRKGLSQARHAGFSAARGDLIANIDADTLVPKGWLPVVMDEFERDQNLVALSGPFIYQDIHPVLRGGVLVFYFFGYVIHQISHSLLRVGGMLQGGNFVVRRTALEKIGGYDTSITFYGEDTDIARRLTAVGQVKWMFRLPMYTSGRRFKAEGIVRVGGRYALNYVWVLFRKKPFTKHHVDIRQQ